MVENLQINRVIIHKIHKRNMDRSMKDPEYSDALSDIKGAGLRAFRNRVVNAIGSDSCSLEMDIFRKSEGSTFDCVKKSIDSDDEDFIMYSKQIALNLAESQTSKKLPGGIVIVFDGTTGEDDKPFIGVIKAELQEGFKLEGLNLNFIDDLILTKHQKFYKIGVFINNRAEDKEDEYIAIVYDSNLNKSNSDAASYFYNNFLGCKKSESEPVLNKTFYIKTRDFINDVENITSEEKLDLNYALYSYMKTEKSGIISVDNFAENYFKESLKAEYKNHMEKENFPVRNIGKDTTLIANILKSRRINFTDDIQLVAPSEKFKDIIKVEANGNETVVTISGSIVKQI